MKSIPRILPLVGVAVGGVLAVNALAGARDLPSLLSGARAFAEEAVKTPAPGKSAKPAGTDAKTGGEEAATGDAKDAVAGGLPPAKTPPKAVCAPTAAELAKQAGLSPAELQVIQSLGARRGQLDKREGELSTQLALMAAAEAKLDAKIKVLNGLKGEVNGLLTQTNAREAAEIDRLVKVYEGMKAKDAAPRLVLLDDKVRLPIAAKMKERALSAIVAQMPAPEAKKLTEALARRYSDAVSAALKVDKVSDAGTTPAAATKAEPVKTANAAPRKRPAPARKPAQPVQQAAAKPAKPASPDEATPAPAEAPKAG